MMALHQQQHRLIASIVGAVSSSSPSSLSSLSSGSLSSSLIGRSFLCSPSLSSFPSLLFRSFSSATSSSSSSSTNPSSSSSSSSSTVRARSLLSSKGPRDRSSPRGLSSINAFADSIESDYWDVTRLEEVAKEQYDVDVYSRVHKKDLLRAYTELIAEREIDEQADIPFSGDDYDLTEAERSVRFPDLAPPHNDALDRPLSIHQLNSLHFRYYLRIRKKLFPNDLGKKNKYIINDPLHGRTRLAKRDQLGRSHGKGVRKTAKAQCWIWPSNEDGGGMLVVNGRSHVDYFDQWMHREEMTRPFVITNTIGQFHCYITTRGGGLSGRAGAIKLAIARALAHYDPNLRRDLRESKLLTVDHRRKEPLKAGRTKARRGWQWVKR